VQRGQQGITLHIQIVERRQTVIDRLAQKRKHVLNRDRRRPLHSVTERVCENVIGRHQICQGSQIVTIDGLYE
jgi:hydroxymethylglutaryl-CoA reductase